MTLLPKRVLDWVGSLQPGGGGRRWVGKGRWDHEGKHQNGRTGQLQSSMAGGSVIGSFAWTLRGLRYYYY